MAGRSISYSPEIQALSLRLGQALKRARIRRKLTQEQVGKRAGLSKQTMSRLESGDPGVAFGNVLEVLMVLERQAAEQVVDLIEADQPGRVLVDRTLPSKVVPEDF